MISAFGVEHGEFSKAMSGRKFKALLATKNRSTDPRAKQYADRRLSLHRVGRRAAEAKSPVIQDKKDVLRDLTRTPYPTRVKNRKAAGL